MSGKNRYFISRSYVVPPLRAGKSHTFYSKHEWFAVNKVKKKKSLTFLRDLATFECKFHKFASFCTQDF